MGKMHLVISTVACTWMRKPYVIQWFTGEEKDTRKKRKIKKKKLKCQVSNV